MSTRTTTGRPLTVDLAPPLLVAAGIMVAAVIPVRVPVGTPGGTGYVVHALLYGVLAAALLWTWRRRGWPAPAWWAVGLAVAYGVLHEVVQAFVPWRSASALDVVADAAGAFAAVTLDALRRRGGAARARSRTGP